MKSLFARLASNVGLALGLASALSLPAAAQCLQLDNLDNTIPCGPAQTVVPQKNFQHQSLGICWNNCPVARSGF